MKIGNCRKIPLRLAKKTQITNDAPALSSPNSWRIKKAQQRIVQDAAFNELLLLQLENSGNENTEI
jgi:hypothetical protein